MFYALYYGVMARDFAEICAEKMASNLGYYRPSGIPGKQLQVIPQTFIGIRIAILNRLFCRATSARCVATSSWSRWARRAWWRTPTDSPALTSKTTTTYYELILALDSGHLTLFAQVPRVLHPGLVHRGQEADVPLLPREGGPPPHVPQSLGEATHDVRTAAGLAAVAALLAAHHTGPGARH